MIIEAAKRRKKVFLDRNSLARCPKSDLRAAWRPRAARALDSPAFMILTRIARDETGPGPGQSRAAGPHTGRVPSLLRARDRKASRQSDPRCRRRRQFILRRSKSFGPNVTALDSIYDLSGKEIRNRCEPDLRSEERRVGK